MGIQEIAMKAAATLLPTSRTGSYRPAGVVADAFDVSLSLATLKDYSSFATGEAGITGENLEALILADAFTEAGIEPTEGDILLIDGNLFEVRSRGNSVSESTCGFSYVVQLLRV